MVVDGPHPDRRVRVGERRPRLEPPDRRVLGEMEELGHSPPESTTPRRNQPSLASRTGEGSIPIPSPQPRPTAATEMLARYWTPGVRSAHHSKLLESQI